jgi:hypothetical protein
MNLATLCCAAQASEVGLLTKRSFLATDLGVPNCITIFAMNLATLEQTGFWAGLLTNS